MHFSTTSILIASVTILAAANPTPQGLDLVESKFANTQKESCYDIEGGPNGYFCDKYSFLVRQNFRCKIGLRHMLTLLPSISVEMW
ncbi:hypothetical protein CB0940_03778 [Cercospora beticola]|uniref:Antifungal protein n=1 Tax=Cercospora beticola TaxID=122368 RepID=A0A2G5I1Z0_CERBT|nr:hypothetical protein CB0940_03778 [Cercospora beticola]PIA98814.1 hypothetical protein CB0940_03778 [Cercospora beticola]